MSKVWAVLSGRSRVFGEDAVTLVVQPVKLFFCGGGAVCFRPTDDQLGPVFARAADAFAGRVRLLALHQRAPDTVVQIAGLADGQPFFGILVFYFVHARCGREPDAGEVALAGFEALPGGPIGPSQEDGWDGDVLGFHD